jgi:hypothetical protein
VVLLLIIGLIVGAAGVFRYNQLSNLAREGARWASVHGYSYAQDFNNGTLITPTDVYTNAIQPKMVGMNTNNFNYTITWDDPFQGPIYYNATAGAYLPNNVHVTITYDWTPELYLFGPIQLKSTSAASMQY